MKDFNIIKWAVKQPKDILLGILIFASSYLVFLKHYNHTISLGKHFLWFLLFLAGSLLAGFFISFLCRESCKKTKSMLNERLLNNTDAAKLFKKLDVEGNKIENSPLYQSGLAGSIDIGMVVQELNMHESKARNFVQKFHRFGWLKYDLEGNIHGVSNYGRDVMYRKKMI